TQIADAITPAGLLALCATIWPAAAFMATRIGDPLRVPARRTAVATAVRQAFGDLARGRRRRMATPAALGATASMAVHQFLMRVVAVLSVVIFKHEFQGGVATYGRILGAGGVGVLVGTITVGSFEDRMARPRIMAMAFAVAAVVSLLVAMRVTAIPI